MNDAERLSAVFSMIEAAEETVALHDYDEAAIGKLEASLGISLPPEFRAFLLRFGSGTYEFGEVPAPDEWDDLIERQGEASHDVADGSVIPFAEHEAGECYCFDYRVDADPRPVVVIDRGRVETWDKVAATFLHLLETNYADPAGVGVAPPAIKYIQTVEQRLLEEATSTDAAKRAKATDKMGEMMKESYRSDALSLAFTPTLLTLTADRSAKVRLNVVYALGYAKGYPDELEAGQEGISRARIVTAILAGLADKDDGVRKAAAGAVGAMRAPEGIPALLAALDDPAAMNDAIWSLGRIGVYTEQVAAGLIALLAAGNDDVKIKILQALAETKLEKESEIAALLPLLDNPRDLVRKTLCATLNRIAPSNAAIFRSAIPLFLKSANEKHFKVRSEMVRLLAALQVEEALPLIKSALNDPELQSNAIYGLAYAPDLATKLIPQLCQFIGVPGSISFGEKNACEALAKAGNKATAAVPYLKTVLAKGTTESNGKYVLLALAGIGTDEALQAVRDAAAAGNAHAVELLGQPSQKQATQKAAQLQYPTWSAFSAVSLAAEAVFPGVPVATWGSPEWHKLPRWEYSEAVEGMDLAPLAWIERRYPLGASIAHAHVLSIGLSNLYDMSLATTKAAAEDPETPSGLGIELSIRVALRDGDDMDAWMPKWVIDQLKTFVDYQLTSGRRFWYGHYSENPHPDAHIPGFAFTFDPSFTQIRSASGTIDILQVILLTRDEVELCTAQKTSRYFLDVFEERYPDAVNVIGRPSLLDTPGTRERILEKAEAAKQATD